MIKKLSNWGNYPNYSGKWLPFLSLSNLQKILKEDADIIPAGNGRSYGDSALSRRVVDMKKHNLFLDFDNTTGVLKLQSGVFLSDIVETFVSRGWFLAVTPGTKLITVGGAIASDVHGKNHHKAGCFSESVIAFTLVLPDGETIRCTKKKNICLFNATCGGMGLTGVVVDVVIQLKRIKSQHIQQTTIKTNNLKATFDAFEQYQDKEYSVAWIDCLAKKQNLGRCLLTVGEFCDDGDLAYAPKKKVSIPFNFPAFSLNYLSVKIFNWLYYGKVRLAISQQKVGLDAFFYPLDAIQHWNRIYGKPGFLQYQCILPKKGSYNGLEKILTLIADSGKGSFLAVLKLHGSENKNYLSFPIEGYSLALDFKVDDGVFDLLDQLDNVVTELDGRIYLAKDARVNKAIFEQGYAKIETFRALRKKYKMDEKFNSLQSKRLGL
jgi:FAD/FMN-containing dehydrogenase